VIPKVDTVLIVNFELGGARAWGERNHVSIGWTEEDLVLRATFTQPETRELFYLKGTFDNYKELPPALTFCNVDWQATGAREHFPKPFGESPFGATIFIEHHGKPVICAPFNRLAYAQNQGPHGDWGGPVHWQTAAADRVHATCIGDMLQIILRDLNLTKGRMGQ
jgi:hypothetical protein